MTSRWTTAVLDTDTPGGWAVARSPEGFLFDENGALFPREWLKRQELSVLAEHGIGHLDGEPVYLLELKAASMIRHGQENTVTAARLHDWTLVLLQTADEHVLPQVVAQTVRELFKHCIG